MSRNCGACVCAALFLSAVLLAVFATPAAVVADDQRRFTTVVLGAVFVLEYAYRRVRYSHHEHFGLVPVPAAPGAHHASGPEPDVFIAPAVGRLDPRIPSRSIASCPFSRRSSSRR